MSSSRIRSEPTITGVRGMRRRILALGAGALASPFRTLAQQPAKVWRIGLLHASTDHVPPSYATLREGMSSLGYEEGRNIRYDYRNLRGKAPADLPIEEITEYQLVVNRSAAKRYGMTIPQSVLIRADEVIE